jgi:hypothetical protein
MRVRGKNVNVFVRVVLRFQQIRIDAPAAFCSSRKLIHAVVLGNAFWERFVHAHDNSFDLRIG